MQANFKKIEIQKNSKKNKKKLSPPVIIMLGFIITIFTGSLLLSLPFARVNNIAYIDLLFTATSAVCVTGLSVLNISTQFTVFGQTVILLMIQIGGLGFMTITTLMLIFIGKKITLKERITLSEAYNQDSLQGLVKLTLYIILFTVIIEIAGAILLSIDFIKDYGVSKGIYYSVFHSVSAFCNAGFSLIDFSDSVYNNNVLVNLSLMSLIFLGGLGFAVLKDIVTIKKASKFSLNTKIVLYTSLTLIICSAVIFAVTEWYNEGTIGHDSFAGKILKSFFQAVTARTAGFNTVNQADLTGASKVLTVFNMFIGASPGSTGGGIKTTTAFMLIVLFISGLKGQEREITIFGKSISFKTAHKAMIIFIYSILTIFIFSFLIMLFEKGNTAITLETAVFEVVSAFATVGLSLGITPVLSFPSKILVINLMFIGRLGFLVLGIFFLQRKQKELIVIKHPETKIIIG